MHDDIENLPGLPRLGANLSFRGGLFFVEIQHPSAERPLQVVLHGISNFEEAARAASLFRTPRPGRELRGRVVGA